MIAGVRFRDGRVFAACLPVKVAAVHHDTAERRAVAAQELGGGVQHDVRAVLDGSDQVRGTKGVVDGQGDAVFVSDGRDGVDIRNVGIGVAQGLEVDGLGVGLDGGLHLRRIVGVHKGSLDAVEGQRVGKQVVTAAINGLLRDNVIARLRQGLDGIGHGCGAGGQGQRAHAAFQRGDAFFQHILGGVGQAAVDVARILQAETGRRMGGVVKHEGRGLINGDGPCVGGGIGLLLADMKLQRFKFIVRHDMYLFFMIFPLL